MVTSPKQAFYKNGGKKMTGEMLKICGKLV